MQRTALDNWHIVVEVASIWTQARRNTADECVYFCIKSGLQNTVSRICNEQLADDSSLSSRKKRRLRSRNIRKSLSEAEGANNDHLQFFLTEFDSGSSNKNNDDDDDDYNNKDSDVNNDDYYESESGSEHDGDEAIKNNHKTKSNGNSIHNSSRDNNNNKDSTRNIKRVLNSKNHNQHPSAKHTTSSSVKVRHDHNITAAAAGNRINKSEDDAAMGDGDSGDQHSATGATAISISKKQQPRSVKVYDENDLHHKHVIALHKKRVAEMELEKERRKIKMEEVSIVQ